MEQQDEPAPRSKRGNNEPKKAKRRSPYIFWLVYVCILILLWFGMEYFNVKHPKANISFWGTAIGILTEIIVLLVTALAEYEKSDRPENISFAEDVLPMLTRLWHRIRKNTFFGFCSLIIVAFLIPSAFAHAHMGGRCIESLVVISSTLRSGLNGSQESDIPQESEAPNDAFSNPENSLSSSENGMDSAIVQSEFLLEPDREMELSSNEWATLLFKDDLGEVMDAGSIWSTLQAAHDQQMPSQFTHQTPETIKGLANEASAKEANMTTSLDLDQCIGLRQQVVKTNPNAKLYDLLAENYHSYALEYLNYYQMNDLAINAATRNTILYYLGLSILALEDELSFQDADYDDCLRRIRSRYKDMYSLYGVAESTPVKSELKMVIEAFDDII